MFKKKKKDNEDDFTIEVAKKTAWENAPKLIDKSADEYRVCMNCQFPLKYDMFVDDMPENRKLKSWTIEIVNLNKPSNAKGNLLAIHEMCKELRKNDNESKRLKKYQDTKWAYPKNIK